MPKVGHIPKQFKQLMMYTYLLSKLGKVCDGMVHCIYGEDESFEICRDTFPQDATVECIENRLPGYDIKIMAIPCDGVQECRDGSDERNCLDDKIILIVVITGFIFSTFCIYQYLVKVKIPKWRQYVFHNMIGNAYNDKWKLKDCINFKGNALAEMKVFFFLSKIMNRLEYLCKSFRMRHLNIDVLNFY